MNLKVDSPVHEKIISIQNDLRIAIQNHHVLFLFKKHFPANKDLNLFIRIIQSLIVRLGRSQAVLMSQLRHEIAVKFDVKPTNLIVFTAMKKLLSFPEAPKYIPVYKSQGGNFNNFKKRLISCKATVQNSLLIENHKPKMKKLAGQEVQDCNSKRVVNSVKSQKSKKLQSILKSNRISVIKKYSTQEGCKSNSKEQPLNNFLNNNNNSSRQIIEAELKSNSTELRLDSSINNTKSNRKTICQTQTVNEETVSGNNLLTKEEFLGYLGLVDKKRYEMLNKKPFQRKRRSLAGCTKFYSDYL